MAIDVKKEGYDLKYCKGSLTPRAVGNVDQVSSFP